MLKNINIRDISEQLYFDALEAKARLKAKNWVSFLEKVVKLAKEAENNNGN